VDDEAFNILVIKGLMRVLGMQNIDSRVDCCYNGEQLVEHVQKAVDEGDPYRYSLILTDCMMPFMDGYEAVKRVRTMLKNHTRRSLCIIAVTGHVEKEYITKAENSGMDIVYPKPLPIVDLGLKLIDLNFIHELPPHLVREDA
jgi:CheY-like chemotaxis protein